MEVLEAELRSLCGMRVPVWSDPVRSLSGKPIGSFGIPAAHAVLLPIGSVTKGHRRMPGILTAGLALFEILPFGLVIVAMLSMDGPLGVVAVVITYVPFFLATSYTLALSGLRGEVVWGRVMDSHQKRMGGA